ncbi:hypothetical protein [Citricoccus sp. NR2]|uniref:hypothetical protein n=1 Tax=Citricoccus sp. NR2 TaxID=3004095 RepID=UPI0022DDD534|nr:hypothetical protein [Citricoccus sp. NR2]WBL18369.1 hypothetical protein O1A05_11365 [Citricoccus sp. NR2]
MSAPEVRRNCLIGPTSLAGVFVGSLFAISACADEPPRAVMNDYLVFSQESPEDDAELLERFQGFASDLDLSTLRQVGSDGDVRFFTGMATTETEVEADSSDIAADQLCFIIDHGPDSAASMTCPTIEGSEQPVAWLWSSTTTGSVEAYLVPDQNQLDLPEGWRQISPNILVIARSESTADAATVMIDNEQVELTRGGKS